MPKSVEEKRVESWQVVIHGVLNKWVPRLSRDVGQLAAPGSTSASSQLNNVTGAYSWKESMPARWKKSHKLKRAEKCETIVFESRGGSRTLAYVDGNRIERVMPLRSYILSKSLLPVAWVDILGVDIIFLAMRVAWNFIAPSVGCCHILRAADWWFCNVPSSFLDGAFCWQAFLFSFRRVRFTTSQFNASTCSLTRDSV